jgi:hypothetical protein
MAVTSTGYQLNKQPIAQSFFIDEPNGIYVTKVDLFFATKDESLPVQIQLRPIVNGLPSDTEIIPGSQVVVAASSINVDLVGPDLTSTSFTFQEPIFLKGLEDYALVVTADSKDYQIYIAEINEFTYGSTERRVNKQPTSGSLFYSQNGVTIRLNNAPVPKKLLGIDPITTTASDATIRIFHLNHGLQVGDTVVISGAVAVGGLSAANINGSRSITARDFTGYTVEAGANATKNVKGGGSLIQVTKNIPYSLIYPSAATLEPKGTTITASIRSTSARSFAGSETAFQKTSAFNGVKLNENNTATIMKLVANATSEASELGSGVKSLDMNLNISTIDDNVAPMLDLQRTSATLIANSIDKQAAGAATGFNVPLVYVDEAGPNGSHAARHLTRVINLESDSVGLRVLLEANVPNSCDFQLYFRTATSDELIQEKNFTLVTSENTNPKDSNPRIFREYRYLIGGQGGHLPAFTKYQLKIVMQSTNQALVPIFQSLRSIALSV